MKVKLLISNKLGLLLLVCAAAGTVLYTACNKEENFPIGEEYMVNQSRVMVIDTFKVEMQTVIRDSVASSGTGQVLVGYNEDPVFGKITCTSYFQLGLPSSYSISKDDNYHFDSISLVLPFNKYYYGDTMQQVSISVHALNESIKTYSTGYLYSASSFDYNDYVIGSTSFIPRPTQHDSIEIPLDMDFGYPFYQNLITEPEYYLNDNAFLKYLKGLVLVPSTASSGPIIGFKGTAEAIKMRIYYHDPGEASVAKMVDYPLINTENQFNQVLHDFTGTALEPITVGRKLYPSVETGGNTFVQGLTALYTRVSFPSIDEIMNFKRGSILRAELVLFPEASSYAQFSLPKTLSLYVERNTEFVIPDYYTRSDPSTQLLLDEWYHEYTSYTLPLTEYLQNNISKNYVNPDPAVIVGHSFNDMMSTLGRVIFSSSLQKPVLRVYYVTY